MFCIMTGSATRSLNRALRQKPTLSVSMIVFEIKLNGESIGRAGTDDLSVLTAIVSAVGKLGANSQGASDEKDTYHVDLSVGGLTARADAAKDEHLDWLKQRLKPGDVIAITILESRSADAPTSTKPAHTEDAFRQQFEWAKKFYLENRDKFEDR